MVRCITCNVLHMRPLQIFMLFSMIWYCRIQSSAMFTLQDIRWYGFRWSIPLSIGYDWNWSIDMAITTPSCSYCIYNRWCHNYRSILLNFLLLAWFDTIEFNRLPWSNNKIYEDAVFADRFRYHFTMIGMCILIRLSRHLGTNIAYEIAI